KQMEVGGAGAGRAAARELLAGFRHAPLVEEQCDELDAVVRVTPDRLFELRDRRRDLARVPVGVAESHVKGGLLWVQADGIDELSAGRRRETEPGVRAAEIVVD